MTAYDWLIQIIEFRSETQLTRAWASVKSAMSGISGALYILNKQKINLTYYRT